MLGFTSPAPHCWSRRGTRRPRCGPTRGLLAASRWSRGRSFFRCRVKPVLWIRDILVRIRIRGSSVADSLHFVVDQDPYLDPRIHASDYWIRIRILSFSSVALKMARLFIKKSYKRIHPPPPEILFEKLHLF